MNLLKLDDETYQKAVQDCEEQMASLATFDGLNLERRGVWVWVSGNTKKHHVAIKGCGFRYAAKKQMWYWKPDYIPNNKSKPASMDYIRNTYTDSAVYNTDEQEAV